MTKDEYKQYLQRTGQHEPSHLRETGKKPINKFEDAENKARQSVSTIRNYLNDYLDDLHEVHGVGSDRLNNFLYRMMFKLRFNTWPNPGIEIDKFASHESRARLSDIYMRLTERPDDSNGVDKRMLTVWDYTGRDSKGRPQLFSEFISRLLDNGYKGLLRKARRQESKLIQIEDLSEERIEGGISLDYAMGCNVFPDDGVIHSNLVPCELARRLEDLRHRLKNHFPTLSYLFLDHGIMSASEMARTVKSREFDWVKRIMDQQEPNPNRPKTPKDRERIGEITSAYRSAYLATIVTFVRERQQRDLDTADSRFPFTPKDLDDEDVLAAECRRTMGWTPRKKNPVGFAMPKLTKEQELGWTGYKFGRGTNPDTSLGADHAAHMSTARSGTQKIKGSLAANDKYEAERAGGNDQE